MLYTVYMQYIIYLAVKIMCLEKETHLTTGLTWIILKLYPTAAILGYIPILC